MKVIVCIFILFIQKIHSNNEKTIPVCPASIFDYQKTKVDWNDNKLELWKWLNYQQKIDKKIKTFCKHDAEYNMTDKVPKPGIQRGFPFTRYKCDENLLTFVKLECQFDREMQPKGIGHVYRLSKPQFPTQGFTQFSFVILPITSQKISKKISCPHNRKFTF